jgi:hypothetical protein
MFNEIFKCGESRESIYDHLSRKAPTFKWEMNFESIRKYNP